MLSVINTVTENIGYLRKPNTWYTVKDGLWSDPTVWSSNAKRKYSFPADGDSVVIANTITLNSTAFPTTTWKTFKDFIVTGTLKTDNSVVNRGFYILGTLEASAGTIDFSAGSLGFELRGAYNRFGTFLSGTSDVKYNGAEGQVIYAPQSGSYYSLSVGDYRNYDGNSGLGYNPLSLKMFGSDIVCTGLLSVYRCNLDLLGFNLTATNFNPQGSGSDRPYVRRSVSAGTVTVTGQLSSVGWLDLNNTPLYVAGFGGQLGGGGAVYASAVYVTASNNFSTGTISFNAPVTVQPGVNFTVSTPNGLNFNQPVNGADATATLTVTPTGVVTWGGAAFEPMSTGTWVMNGSAIYKFSSNYTITKTSFVNLSIGDHPGGYASGIVGKLSGDTTTSGYLRIYQSRLDLNGYNCTANGVGANYGLLQSCGIYNTGAAGKVLSFAGDVSMLFCVVNMPGNTVEFKGGITNQQSYTTETLSCDILFSTANKVITNTTIWNVTGTITIADGVTVTFNPTMTHIGQLNGAGAGAMLDNRGNYAYQYIVQPMQIGALQCNNAVNTFQYSMAGPQDIAPGTYRNLTLKGSGTKRLIGNVSVINTYTLTAPATLDSNGYSLTNP